MGRSRDNGTERAVHGPLASPLGPGAQRVSGGGFWLRPITAPATVQGKPRVIGAFSPCCVCGAGTWLFYGGQAYCTTHALEAAT